MKITAILIAMVGTVASMSSMGADFIQGFEMGMMQRNNDDVFEEYGCDPAEGSNRHIDSFVKMF